MTTNLCLLLKTCEISSQRSPEYGEVRVVKSRHGLVLKACTWTRDISTPTSLDPLHHKDVRVLRLTADLPRIWWLHEWFSICGFQPLKRASISKETNALYIITAAELQL